MGVASVFAKRQFTTTYYQDKLIILVDLIDYISKQGWVLKSKKPIYKMYNARLKAFGQRGISIDTLGDHLSVLRKLGILEFNMNYPKKDFNLTYTLLYPVDECFDILKDKLPSNTTAPFELRIKLYYEMKFKKHFMA